MADRSVKIQLSGERNPAGALVEAIAGAVRCIDAVVYKFDLPEIFKAFEEALDRGIAVRLVVDKRLIDRDKKNGFTRMLAEKSGATVKKWTGGKLHAKFVIIDGRQVLSGSYNWTESAKERNTELLLCFDDEANVARFITLFNDLWTDPKAL